MRSHGAAECPAAAQPVTARTRAVMCGRHDKYPLNSRHSYSALGVSLPAGGRSRSLRPARAAISARWRAGSTDGPGRRTGRASSCRASITSPAARNALISPQRLGGQPRSGLKPERHGQCASACELAEDRVQSAAGGREERNSRPRTVCVTAVPAPFSMAPRQRSPS